MLYPKVKGQRGGGFVWSDVERTQIDVLAGDLKPSSGRKMKRLKQFSKLFQLRQRRPKYKKSRQRDQVKHGGGSRLHSGAHSLGVGGAAVNDQPHSIYSAKDDDDDDVDYQSMGAAAVDDHARNGAVLEEEAVGREMEDKLSGKLIEQRKYSGD